MSKSVLLLGGSGFLGSALRRSLQADEQFSVFSAGVRPSSDNASLVIDLLESEDVEKIRDFDIVVNLTGQITAPFSQCHSLNTVGIQHILDVLHAEQFMVQISTTQVYGTTRFADESSPLHPETPYASAKTTAESLLQAGLPAERLLIVRLTNLYGPGQTKGLLWYLTDCIKSGKIINIPDNNGDMVRHFLHVEDAARLLHALIAARVSGIVNIPGSQRSSIRELIALCERILGRKLPATYASAPPTGNIDEVSSKKLQELVLVDWKHSVEEHLQEQMASAHS